MIKFENLPSEETPLSAENLNQLQQDLAGFKYVLILTEDTTEGAIMTLPCYYESGNTLEVYWNGEKLIKTSISDTEGVNGHYYETGQEGDIVNTIQITSDWSASAGDVFEFIVKGEYSL